MTEQKAKEAIEKAQGSWEVFIEFMRGQTMGFNEDGTVDFYDSDVDRFIRYKCNPKNEPLVDFD